MSGTTETMMRDLYRAIDADQDPLTSSEIIHRAGPVRPTTGIPLPRELDAGVRSIAAIGIAALVVLLLVVLPMFLVKPETPPLSPSITPPTTMPAIDSRIADYFDPTDWIAVWLSDGTSEGRTYLVHPDGTERTRIKLPAAFAAEPDWSPDGTKVVVSGLESATGIPRVGLYEYDLARIPEHRFGKPLFRGCDINCGDLEPAYSPDGTHLAFIRTPQCGIWIGAVATGEVEEVTNGSGRSSGGGCLTRSPRWSPDGDKLVFSKEEAPGSANIRSAIFVIDLTSRDISQLTDFDLDGTDPDWSPDGDWIVFGTNALLGSNGTGGDLYRVRPQGSDLQQLTFLEPPRGASDPRYTPDGDWIVFTIDGDIWVIRSDGEEAFPLLTGETYGQPAWQP